MLSKVALMVYIPVRMVMSKSFKSYPGRCLYYEDSGAGLTSSYHYMQLSREVIVGKGTLRCVPDVVKRLGIKGSALIVAGTKSCTVAGKTVHDLLEQANVNVDTLLVPAATIRDVLNCLKTNN